MATTAKKTTAKKTTAKKTTTKATTARKAPAKKAATTKTAATKTTTSTTSAQDGFRLSIAGVDLAAEDVKGFVTDYAYATVGASDRVVEVARELPERLAKLGKTRTEQAESFVAETRGKVETFVKEAPAKLQAELNEERSMRSAQHISIEN